MISTDLEADVIILSDSQLQVVWLIVNVQRDFGLVTAGAFCDNAGSIAKVDAAHIERKDRILCGVRGSVKQ